MRAENTNPVPWTTPQTTLWTTLWNIFPLINQKSLPRVKKGKKCICVSWGAFDRPYFGIGIHGIQVINPSFYGDSHYISKHLLKCYFKHIFIIFVPSKRQAYPFKSLLHVFLERFSNECRKTKTKVITLANQKGRRQSSKPIKTRSNYTWPTQSAGKCARASYDWFWFHF